MIENKMKQLARSLRDQSTEGNVTWEASSRDNWFQTTFPRYTVQIGETSTGYSLRLYDLEDRLLEELSTDAGLPDDTGFVMRDLHTAARHKALGVESALDDILGNLTKRG